MPEQIEMQIGKTPVYLVKDNTSCTIIPEVPGLRELLSFVQKDLQPKPDLFFSNGKVYKHDPERNVWKLRGKEYLDADGVPFDPVTQTAMQGTWKRGRGNEVVRKTVHAYNEIPNPSYKVLQTYQGLWRKVRDWLVQQGHPVTVHSDCTPIQPPQLNLMRGFRFSQQALTYELLIKEESGLLCAPTRYGKSTIIKNVLRAYPGVNTVVTVPGDDVLEQLYQDIKAAMPKRNVVKLGGSKSAKGPSDDITVCSMDSLHRCDHLHTRLLLIDEPHSAVTDSRMPEFQKFVNARKLGFGATLDGRFDGRDMLIEGIIGPVLANRTYTEAVAEGAIAPIRVLTLKVPFKDFPVKTRQGAYNRLVFNNYELNSTINELLRQVVPQDMQALVFINNEKQAEGMLEVVGAPNVIAMAKKMTSAQRAELVDKMKTNQISRCIASNIFSTGVTFSDLAVVVMAAGGGGSISAIQKPGRIAEVRPGKKYGFVIDFLRQCTDPEAQGADTAWQTVIRDDQARLDTYRAKGYEVTVCEDIEELNKLFQQCL